MTSVTSVFNMILHKDALYVILNCNVVFCLQSLMVILSCVVFVEIKPAASIMVFMPVKVVRLVNIF